MATRAVAVLACLVCVCSAATTVSLECCVLLEKLHTFVATETDVRAPGCSESTCSNSRLMQLFRKETKSHLPSNADESVVEFTIPQIDDALFSEILVWAFIGRHYTSTLAGTNTHFVFNTATSTMTAKMPKCEFQKPVYTILLFVSILLLIFSLVLQNLKLMEQNQPDSATKVVEQSQRDITATNMSMFCTSLDFAPRRKVVGGRCYTAAPFGMGEL